MNGHIFVFTGEQLLELARQGEALNAQINFAALLQSRQYKQLPNGFFLRKQPPELIELTTRDGKTTYINHFEPKDKGTLMDYLRNRSMEEGKIIPNEKIHTFAIAIATAREFLQSRQPPVPTGKKHGRPRAPGKRHKGRTH